VRNLLQTRWLAKSSFWKSAEPLDSKGGDFFTKKRKEQKSENAFEHTFVNGRERQYLCEDWERFTSRFDANPLLLTGIIPLKYRKCKQNLGFFAGEDWGTTGLEDREGAGKRKWTVPENPGNVASLRAAYACGTRENPAKANTKRGLALCGIRLGWFVARFLSLLCAL
jgi:hypothetical protein